MYKTYYTYVWVQDKLMTVLEVMLHDPMYDWSVGPSKAAAKQVLSSLLLSFSLSLCLSLFVRLSLSVFICYCPSVCPHIIIWISVVLVCLSLYSKYITLTVFLSSFIFFSFPWAKNSCSHPPPPQTKINSKTIFLTRIFANPDNLCLLNWIYKKTTFPYPRRVSWPNLRRRSRTRGTGGIYNSVYI